MVGGVFLAYQNRPPKWRIFKYRRWKKEMKYRPICPKHYKPKDRVLKYR